MFQGITRRLPDRGRILRVLAAWSVLATILVALPTQNPPKQPTQPLTNRPKVAAAESSQPATNNPPQAAPQSKTATTPTPKTPTKKKTDTTPQTTTANSATHPETPATPAPTEIAVSLELNGIVQGDVKLPSDGNQCNVLSRALEQGTIDSLDMRYSSQYKTYAVYVINGVGDSGSVWWTYKVNGKSPPLGCSNTKVHSGDRVNWEYVKQ